MDKKISKWKIILILVAIVLAITSFSIGIFGIIEHNKKEKESEGAVTNSGNFTFTYGGVTTTMYYEYDPILGRGDEQFYKVYSNSSKNTLEFYHTYSGGMSDTAYIYTENGLRILGYIIKGGNFPNDKAPSISLSSTFVYLENNITIGATGWESFEKMFYSFDYKGHTITNNSGKAIFIDLVINTVQDLKNFATNVNNGVQYTGVVLGKNINFSSSDTMIPIGTSSNPFKGTFDGCGYTISNLPVSSCDYHIRDGSDNLIYDSKCYGLFGFISGATIKNLQIDATWNITTGKEDRMTRIGLLVGLAESGTNNIEDVLITGSSISVTTPAVQRKTCLGSIVGMVEYSAILNISRAAIDCDLTMNSTGAGAFVGGFVGINWGRGAITNINSSYYYGDVYIKSSATGGTIAYGGAVGLFGIVLDETSSTGLNTDYFMAPEAGSLSVNNTFINLTSLNINIDFMIGGGRFNGTFDIISKWCSSHSNNKYYIKSNVLNGKYYDCDDRWTQINTKLDFDFASSGNSLN
ncbi:MAG: hypothetical protein IKA36_03095 [Clostridia bacterium]|nr:hypothetical protein [Clostridia bacterium]